MTFLKKILMVECEPRASAFVRGALEPAGEYVIGEERSGRLALNTAQFFQPDLILFDTLSSERSAIVHAFQTDSVFRDTPLLFLEANTSSAGEGMISRGILNGYSFLASPVRREEFAGYVAELLAPAQAA